MFLKHRGREATRLLGKAKINNLLGKMASKREQLRYILLAFLQLNLKKNR